MSEGRWPRNVPRLMADAIVLHEDKLVLVRRRKEPFRGMYGIPGGFVELRETPEEAAIRETFEETSLRVRVERLLGVYGDPKRDPRGHLVSVVYVVRSYEGEPRAGDDVDDIRLIPPFDDMPKLAADHNRIILDYLHTVRGDG